MRGSLNLWLQANRVLLSNAASIVTTVGVNSVLGFLYWWLAARLFPQEEVGFASTAVSAMILLGTMAMLGLGTLLIGELPRRPEEVGSLVVTSLAIAGVAGAALGIMFAVVAPYLSDELQPLSAGIGSVVIFASGVAFTALTIVLDQVLIGLLSGGIQLWRNVIFSVAKLIALWLTGIWLVDRLGMVIYITWVLGIVTSMIVLVGGCTSFKGFLTGGNNFRLQLSLLSELKRSALAHHALNLIIEAPARLLPLIVTVLLSATMTASFYVAWMIAALVFVGSDALTLVLYAVGTKDTSILSQKVRMTLKLSFIIGLLGSSALLVTSDLLLNLFGVDYAEQAGWCLRIMGLAVFPLVVKTHYVAICRICSQIGRATAAVLTGSAFELILAGIGASLGGLTGLSLGWLVAVCIEAIFMAPTVYHAATSRAVIVDQQASNVSSATPSTSAGYPD